MWPELMLLGYQMCMLIGFVLDVNWAKFDSYMGISSGPLYMGFSSGPSYMSFSSGLNLFHI